MPPELAQWITPAILVLGFLYLDRSIRRVDQQVGDLRNQIGELRERMAHLEGLLEGLREAITRKSAA